MNDTPQKGVKVPAFPLGVVRHTSRLFPWGASRDCLARQFSLESTIIKRDRRIAILCAPCRIPPAAPYHLGHFEIAVGRRFLDASMALPPTATPLSWSMGARAN